MWRAVKLNQDVAFCFDRLAIDECGLIAPFLNGLQGGRNETCAAKNWLYVFYPAILVDSGGDADEIDGTDLS